MTVRALFHVCSVILVFSYGLAYAQQPSEQAGVKPSSSAPAVVTKPNEPETPQQIKTRAKDFFKVCLKDWDAATHMTKREWEQTCRRVALERSKHLLEMNKYFSAQ
jgi:hypothetical protein